MIRLLFSLFLVALAGFVFFQFSQPVLEDITALRAEKEQLVEGLDNAKELRQVMEERLATFRSLPPADLARLNKFLPDNVDNVRFIIDVNAIAQRSGMAIRNLRLKTEEAETAVVGGEEVEAPAEKGIAAMGFTVAGPYLNLKAFLADLAKSLRLVDVASLSASFPEDGRYTYSFEVKTYWLR